MSDCKKSNANEEYPEMDFYLNQELSDVCFIVDGQRLPALKSILIVKSQVFRAQFSGNFADSGQKEITITDATLDGFKAMLWFIHSDQLVLSDDKNIDLVKDVYHLADKYQLKRLMKSLDNHFKNLIDINNFADIYVFAFERSFDGLMAVLKEFIGQNIGKWVDKDMKTLKELDKKTDNSLLEVIVGKHREAKTTFNNVVYRTNNYGQTTDFPLFKGGENISTSTKMAQTLLDKINFTFDRMKM